MLAAPPSTKDKLLHAALRIGARDGLEAVTTAAIAAEAGGVSMGSQIVVWERLSSLRKPRGAG